MTAETTRLDPVGRLTEVPLGEQGLTVSAQGLGAMGMTAFYVADPKVHETESLATFDEAQALGVTHIDTAWIYMNSATGDKNEELVAKAIKKYGRGAWKIATKFGFDGKGGRDSSPENIRKQCDESLARLGTDYIDLFYQHRPDPKVPIETVMATLKELHAAGKIRYVGLSEMTADELRRAHAVHPVSAIQIEWSLQTRGFAADVVPTARELGVGIVAYSPLGRGLLTGAVASKGDLDAADWRHKNPRFAEETLAHNAAAGARLASIGARFGASAAQVALAWVHAQGADVVPIPGTKSSKRLRENAAAYELSKRLTAADLEEISAAVPEAAGARY